MEFPALPTFVCVNRLTGGLMAHNTDKRKLRAHVRAKGKPGTWYDILYVERNEGQHWHEGGIVSA